MKKFLRNQSIYYNKETPFCLLSKKLFLNLERMDVIYALYKNTSIVFTHLMHVYIIITHIYICMCLVEIHILKNVKPNKIRHL